MSPRGCIYALVLCAGVSTAPAADSEANVASSRPATAPAPDYSGVFERIYALGLPDVTGGAWMEDPFTPPYLYASEGGGKPAPAQGFFLLPEKAPGVQPGVDGVEGFYFIPSTPERRRTSSDEPLPLSEALQKLPESEFNELRELSVKPADLGEQIAAVRNWVESKTGSSRSAPWSDADALIFAAHVRRLGRTTDANNLAASIFARRDQREVMTQVLQRFALTQYQSALLNLGYDAKWGEFADKLDEILARYGSNWPDYPLVLRVRDEARRQAERPRQIPLAGEPWSDAEREFAEAFLKHGNLYYQNHLQDWMIPQLNWLFPIENDRFRPQNEQFVEARKLLMTHGAKALPALAALTSDETWLGGEAMLIKYNETDMDNDIIHLNSPRSETDMEEAWRMHFPRPPSRADIAKSALDSVVPDKFTRATSFGRKTEIRDVPAFEKWAREAAAMPTASLARSYVVQDITSETGLQALKWLAWNANGDDAQFLENTVLGYADIWDVESAASAYMARRGSDAKTFAEKLIPVLDVAIARPRFASEFRMKGLQALRLQSQDIVNGVAFNNRIRGLASVSDADWRTGMDYVQYRFSGAVPRADEISAVVDLARATSGRRRYDCMNLLASTGTAGGSTARLAIVAVEIRKHSDVWREFMADPTVIEQTYRTDTTGDLAAEVIVANLEPGLDGSIFSEDRERIFELGNQRATARYRRHAEALLAGAPLSEPFVPDLTPLGAEKIAALAATARTGNVIAWRADISALSDAEYLSWRHLLEDDPAMAQTAMPLANLVAEIQIADKAPPEIANWARSVLNQSLTSGKVNELFELAGRLVSAGQSGYVDIDRERDGTGWHVKVSALGELKHGTGFRVAGSDWARVDLLARQGTMPFEHHTTVTRRFRTGSTQPVDSDQDMEMQLQETLKALFSSNGEGGIIGFISVKYSPPGTGTGTAFTLREIDPMGR